MSDQPIRQDRDLVLSPTQYAYVQDRTSGNVRVWVGPRADTLTANDRLVIWTGRKFAESPDINQARQSFVTASEGQYVVLVDPAAGDSELFPDEGSTKLAEKLDVGKRIVIPGPRTFPLWPGQTASVLDGHHLNLNQYLVAQVYEPDAAQANMERQIAAPQQGEGDAKAAPTARKFTMGERIVIRGTDVSFYVPPTGIEVVPEVDAGGKQSGFVREAATLEQLEYAVLTNENGRKRYERGPAVIFPDPTETFIMEKGSRKFRAIELNPQSGLYIKVIANYEDDDGTEYHEGDERFITGADMPIYFPRAEEAVIHYGEQRKHYAVAIPAGEGRYVLDRTKGNVGLIEGPDMFLPDPRSQVMVRRVLDPATVAMMYPGNAEAAQVNAQWNAEQAQTGEDFLMANVSASSAIEAGSLPRSYAATATFAGDKVRRSTTYTPPRTITLDTKYQGAVAVSVWPGYAVLVMDKTGNRRVETGPENLLLAYDESLMALRLSTGRPKTDADPIRTVHLRTVNNAVGDRLIVETRDLVPVILDLSLRVNFEGDEPMRWFDVEDYVALLTDHCRSRLRNAAKHHGIEEFYSQTTDIIRDTLLGESKDGKREGLAFAENGMRLYDVEVLGANIQHPSVAGLLTGSTIRAIEGAIQLSEAEENATREKRLQELERAAVDEFELTNEKKAEARIAEVRRLLSENVERIESRQREAEGEAKVSEITLGAQRVAENQRRELTAEMDKVELARLHAEVAEFVARAKAIDPSLVAAIQSFGDQRFTEELVRAVGPAAYAAGTSSADLLHQQLKGTPLEGILATLTQRPLANGSRALEGSER